MASGTTVFIPSNGANIIQMAPGLPSVALQASGGIPYPQYGAQQLQISTSAPQQVPQMSPLERFLKAKPKVLGAVQILIGLIHIGFGVVLLSSRVSLYFLLPFFAVGGYPFWGGIFFIFSGSLCVAAVNDSHRGLVKSSVGMNITSAIMALIGIILYLWELSLNSPFWRYHNQYDTDSLRNVSYGFFYGLLFFSLLEFCIAASLAHFGCQATCCRDDQPTVVFVPYQVIRDGEIETEPNPPTPPPAYDTVVTKSQ